MQHLYLSIGRELELGGRYRDALDIYDQMQADAQAKGSQDLEFSGLMAHAKIYATPNPEQDPTLAKQLLEEALAYTHRTQNPEDEARVLWNLLVLSAYGGGDFSEAIQLGEQALAISRENYLEELTPFILNDLTYAYLGSNQTLLTRKTQREAARLWRKIGNLPMLVNSLSISIPMAYLLGDYERAIQESEEALELRRLTGNEWGQAGSLAFIGLVFHELGQIDRALESYQMAYELGIKTKHRAAYIIAPSCLAWLLADLGDINQALTVVNRAYKHALATQTWYLPVWALMIIVQLHLRNNDLSNAQQTLMELRQIDKSTGLRWFTPIFVPLSEAELSLNGQDYSTAMQTIDGLLEYLEQTGTRTLVSDALVLKAQAQVELGLHEDAWHTLLQARQAAEDIGSQRSLWRVLAKLAMVYELKGDHVEAAQLRGKIREVLQYIFDHISNEELRNSFLNRREVREHLQT